MSDIKYNFGGMNYNFSSLLRLSEFKSLTPSKLASWLKHKDINEIAKKIKKVEEESKDNEKNRMIMSVPIKPEASQLHYMLLDRDKIRKQNLQWRMI